MKLDKHRISLTIPREPEFFSVARLAVSGVAARANLTYDEVEDLKLATDEVLELSLISKDARGPVTLNIQYDDSMMKIAIGDLYERSSTEEELFVLKENVLETKLFLLRYLVNEVQFRTIEPGIYRMSLIKDLVKNRSVTSEIDVEKE